MKRALIFSLSYFPLVGGAEVALKEITDRISPSEIEFDMVTLRFSRSHPKFEKVGNVNVYRIGGGFGYLSKILFVPLATIFALRRQYNFYWAMMTYMLFPISLVRLLGERTHYVLTLQDGDPFTHVFSRLRIAVFKPLLSYGFRQASKVQTISHFLATWASGMGYRGTVEVIPNGVDLGKFSNNNSQFSNGIETILITTSRLVEKNGVGDVVEALKLLPESVRFRILGVGPLETELRARVEKLGLESRVEFVGFVSQADVPEHLSRADIFIRPSLSEGQGISFIEAMAAGLPVIATPVGGIPDFLRDGETGVFCEPQNPESIARAVERLMSDESLRKMVVENASKMVREKYDWSFVVGEMRKRVFNLA